MTEQEIPSGVLPYFVGYLQARLEARGRITPGDWNEAVQAALGFSQVIELDNYRHAD